METVKKVKYKQKVRSIFLEILPELNSLEFESFESIVQGAKSEFIRKKIFFETRDDQTKKEVVNKPLSFLILLDNTLQFVSRFIFSIPHLVYQIFLCVVLVNFFFQYHAFFLKQLYTEALLVLIWIPLFFALILCVTKVLYTATNKIDECFVKLYAFWCSFAIFGYSLLMYVFIPYIPTTYAGWSVNPLFNQANIYYPFFDKHTWMRWAFFSHYSVDGFSVYFLLLTTFSICICVLASWNLDFKNRCLEYFTLFFILEFCLLNVFTQQNIFFFLFFLKPY